MNEALKVQTERRSCRSYRPDPIPAEILDQILISSFQMKTSG